MEITLVSAFSEEILLTRVRSNLKLIDSYRGSGPSWQIYFINWFKGKLICQAQFIIFKQNLDETRKFRLLLIDYKVVMVT